MGYVKSHLLLPPPSLPLPNRDKKEEEEREKEKEKKWPVLSSYLLFILPSPLVRTECVSRIYCL